MFKGISEGFNSIFISGKKEEGQNGEKKKPQNIHEPKFFSVQTLQNNNKKVILHSQYQIKQEQEYFEEIQTYVLLANQKKSLNAGKIKNKFELQYYPSFQFSLAKCKMQDQKCTICLCEFEIKQGAELEKELFEENEDDIFMLRCSHMFHLGCLKNLIGEKDWAKCPVCSTIFGIMTGDQPQGTMNVTFDKFTNIPGHGKGAIIINYIMGGGVRKGVPFAGTSRTAYLPDNKQGREVLALFREAFKRKLIFTVGRSVTTGRDNQTVWNGIHHKTSINGGVASFGYPDETYLSRVKEELGAKGLTLESIGWEQK